MSPIRRPGPALARRYASGLAFALAFVLVVAAVVAPGAEEAVVRSVELSPARFVPGDTVTARLGLAAPGGAWRPERVEPARDVAPGAEPGSEPVSGKGEAIAGADEPTILSLELEADGRDPSLVIRFIPWVAGENRLPELRVGGLSVPSVRITCGSALTEGGTAPPEAFAQLVPEGLFPRLYLLGGLGLASILAALAAGLKGLPAFKAYLARRAERLARKVLDEALRGLSGCEPATWAVLCSALRRFAGLRSGLDLLPLTPVELRALGPEALPGGVAPELATLLETGDAVRYGGRVADAASAVALASSLADRMDAALEAGS